MALGNCGFCNENYVIGVQCCPHCMRPALYPNVQLAEQQEEVDALRLRYDAQIAQAKSAGNESLLRNLEAVVAQSVACKGMRGYELERLIDSDTATAATYYNQITGKVRLPDDNRWDRLRRIADASFFQCFGSDIHFAALSTSNNWLKNYGEGAVFFKDEMIAHRATVFEKNTAMWVDEHNGDLTIPIGYRSTWGQRGKLAVAKLGGVIGNSPNEIDSLLLASGSTSSQDVFIEVHIYGVFTIRSINAVVAKRGAFSELGWASILERMNKLSITFSELP